MWASSCKRMERLEAHLIADLALRCRALSICICVLCFVPPWAALASCSSL